MEVLSGEDDVTFTVVDPPVLSIAKEVVLSRDPIQPGDTLTYTITVVNTGPADAEEVHITDVLPEGVIGTSVDVTVTVPKNDAYIIVIPAQLAEDAVYGDEIINIATYAYNGLIGNAEASITVAGAPQLAVEKTVELARIPSRPGDTITYTITITNLGQSDAVDVLIVDVLPVELDGENLDMTVTIPAGSVYQVVVTATVAANVPYGARVTNRVDIYHPSGDVSASVSFDLLTLLRVNMPLMYREP
jgi:uncharacterized repeat protein (TIGR01451 family)